MSTTNSKENGMYRQGDILIIPTKSIPQGLQEVPLENGRIVLAHGEVTGHAHVLDGDGVFLAADLAEMGERFLKVEQESQVVHDEHATIMLPKGDYIVRRQREHAPEASMMVAD